MHSNRPSLREQSIMGLPSPTLQSRMLRPLAGPGARVAWSHTCQHLVQEIRRGLRLATVAISLSKSDQYKMMSTILPSSVLAVTTIPPCHWRWCPSLVVLGKANALAL
jgi:hypothetical protein